LANTCASQRLFVDTASSAAIGKLAINHHRRY
jgi:hypothetical protein